MQILVHLMCLTEEGGVPYWLMVRQQKADARRIIAFLGTHKKVLISLLTTNLQYARGQSTERIKPNPKIGPSFKSVS